MAAETVCRVWSRFLPISVTESLIFRRRPSTNALGLPCRHSFGFPSKSKSKSKSRILIVEYRVPSRILAAAGWFSGFGGKKKPDIVKAGDPVLHEPAADVPVADIGSQRIEEIIEDMIAAMRNSPGVGLAAPQIGVPLNIIVLEDTKQYISYASRKEIEMQDRRSFDLLVILNPKLKKKGTKTALFFEGCLSVDGFRAVVERHLEVEVTGLDRSGRPIKIDAAGWQARILQHECDHLDGTIFVDKMVPRTFRTVENLDLPLPMGCPKLGVQ
ncbi:peptide deformylase 1A, chloroplastic [Dioscorea cayenensis subsp. rotundata]|uniref:Peptide deformylase n=1 Tax=Dioscorea cayennensis subsp. rotundata TaxID=55577 RepID=A0AB40AR25_DIOCR|nr:peptide deformylase 1A, chloroplastic [Dioscorea cayenensis subsp. rotundata]